LFNKYKEYAVILLNDIQNRFKPVLQKLSISSKEAVVDGNSNSFDAFKTYLHLDPVCRTEI
jgi:hypothetical protein